MLVSICIPQYNRSRYLLVVLESIRRQDYPDIEVVISDDCSTDDSERVIPEYVAGVGKDCDVRFRYIRQKKNLGYDANLRASMAGATGDYLFLLGNDDALPNPDSISRLVRILERLGCPDVAFANFGFHGGGDRVVRRAMSTGVVGSGPGVAVKYFRSFSFVGGIAMKQSAFRAHDTNAHDGSIYVQIYLAARIIASGGILATIEESLVAKDVVIPGEIVNSYVDVLEASNRRFIARTGGLDQVGKVACDAILPYAPGPLRKKCMMAIYGQILSYSYPYWLLDYRKRGVYRASVNLALGCLPARLVKIEDVPLSVNASLLLLYLGATAAGLLTPVRLLERVKGAVYRFSKRD